ncbi:ComEC/Rec2 family competence protein [Ruminococcus flavefaciens]|uniref:Metal-dependent hydrolase, beta-lactamase superfamily II n=1 Tax=Ruminococcus flavefaciens TaxID=1265 RepID=A0A1M7ILJ1_RUMFL|nr:ComEC/Rec2 family competence protein [Ruminococcus flavefaciens]SHM41590.1 Metal-dependent hydrolase, beta-lactamase superfamily II [Ruminococcus flavefaciens]
MLIVGILIFICRYHWKKPAHTFPARDILEVHFIDVGQGDCTFIAANGTTMLVDCGEDAVSSKVIKYLRKLGIGKLDYIIATHPHSDHMGGMHHIIETFDVGEVIIPHIPDEQLPTAVFYDKFLDACEDRKTTVTEAAVGRIINIGDARAEIIAPDDTYQEDINNYSVSFMLYHGENSFLLTGDAEYEEEAAMLKAEKVSSVNVYKAGHHGSAYSSTYDLLRVIQPDIAVISCGMENPYGHPAKSTINRLKEYTDHIYRTDICGTVVIESDGKKLSVTPERSAE